MPADIPLKILCLFFVSIFIIGLLLTLKLYKFNVRKFLASSLFTKIFLWLPIFLIFLLVLYQPKSIGLIVLLTVATTSIIEILLKFRSNHKKILIIYSVAFGISILYFLLIYRDFLADFINLMITLAFATVLADVFAFFFGNYFGKHSLPESINKNKSWEGVLGQIIGALVGVLLVDLFIGSKISIWIALPIGVGSAAGDLFNSYVKRQLNIKDWSPLIPGHGGFTDRFSSFCGSAVLIYYYLKIFT